jgi:transcriptional regulator with PAS, ATPase and Fis domain
MQVLLTFIGNNDCLLPEKPGPILGILERMSFDKVVLLYNNEKYLPAASRILKYIDKKFPATSVHYTAALASSPIDYNIVYPAMYKAVEEIREQNSNAEFTISLTSGTPTMHACWVLLVQGGVIPARLIQISRENGVELVDLSLDDFPAIQKVPTIKAKLTSLTRENRVLQSRLGLPLERIVGTSPAILRVKEQIQLFSDSDLSVHIYGETGTGKELVAEALHFLSSRREKSFVPINCGAIPPNLFESELFGYKKGAFTGANAEKKGLLHHADGGTLFLDEIGEMPIDMQAKLLRVLQEGKYYPVGSRDLARSEFRLISASNRDIKQLASQGLFREDLFYRIVAGEISLPPLRERGQDIILLAQHILLDLNRKHDTKKKFSPDTLRKIMSADWPGNVRQLRHSIEAGFVYPGEIIKSEYLQIIDFKEHRHEITIPDDGVSIEKEILPAYYRAALAKSGGNAEKAA